MPAKKRAAKKAAKKVVRKSTRKRPTAKRAKATRVAKRTVAKATKKTAKRRRATAPVRSPEPVETPSMEPDTHTHAPLFDPKAERMHEHMKKMRGIESQRMEERHAMTRGHRKNQ